MGSKDVFSLFSSIMVSFFFLYKKIKIYLIIYFSPNLRSKTIKILSIRIKNSVSLEKSVFFEVILPSSGLNPNEMKWVGWEQNEKGKLLPKVANMADSMDPEK